MQETSEPQGGLGAVESLVGRGRMGDIFGRRGGLLKSHLYLRSASATRAADHGTYL
jgi:hypothetical protein